jgi:hypothetical protein
MRKRQAIEPAILLWVVAMAALALAIVPIQARAQECNVNCSSPTDADCDGDGFSDYDECQPYIVFPDGTTQFTGLNPNEPDLFVVLTQDANGPGPSLIPADLAGRQALLESFSKAEAVGGLGIRTHVVDPAVFGVPLTQSDRRVCPDYCQHSSSRAQKAVWIGESLEVYTGHPGCPPPDEMPSGVANIGTPNDPFAGGTVYTRRIKWRIDCAYASKGLPTPPGLVDEHIKHTFSHELGHNVYLRYLIQTNRRDKRIIDSIGYHYDPKDVLVMSQSTYYTSKGNNVTFYIGENYDADGVDAYQAQRHLDQ